MGMTETARCAMCGGPSTQLFPVLPRGLASQVLFCGHARRRAETFVIKASHPDRGWPNEIRLCEECDARLRATYLFAERVFYPQPAAATQPEAEAARLNGRTSAEVVYLHSPGVRFRHRNLLQ